MHGPILESPTASPEFVPLFPFARSLVFPARPNGKATHSNRGKVERTEGEALRAGAVEPAMVRRASGLQGGRTAENYDGMMRFDGEARFKQDRSKSTLGALRREGFQPARRHPSAARNRYLQQRAQTDDELDDEPMMITRGGATGYYSDGQAGNTRRLVRVPIVRREPSGELDESFRAASKARGLRQEHSNENLGKRATVAVRSTRSLSAPPVRAVGNEQVSRVSSEMKLARATSAAHYIASKVEGTKNTDVFTKSEIRDLYSWLKIISLQDYLPVLLQMGIEQISHLVDLDAEDLQDVGMTRPERKRFLRKQAELAFDDAMKCVSQPITSQDAISELGERAFSSISDLECVDRPISAQNSHRSQLSAISASSSCMPSLKDDREQSSSSPSSMVQPREEGAKTIDLSALEQRAQAICRIQRISDDVDLGFGYIHTLKGQPCIVTTTSVLGAREDSANALAVFSDGEVLMTCCLDADSLWVSSDDIGYCAVGAIFDRPEYTTKVPDAVVYARSCKGEERIVMCHWSEVDKQFTIHKVSSTSSDTVQFPIRGGIWAAAGTPVFVGDYLLGLSTGDSKNKDLVTVVRADKMISHLSKQSQSGATCYVEGKTSEICANSEERMEKNTISVQTPAVDDKSSPLPLNEEGVQARDPEDPKPRGKKCCNSDPETQNSNGFLKESRSQDRRPLRPVNTLPSVSVPNMLGGKGEHAPSNNKLEDVQMSEEAQPPQISSVKAFNISCKEETGNCQAPVGVALSFLDQNTSKSETPMAKADEHDIQDEASQPQYPEVCPHPKVASASVVLPEIGMQEHEPDFEPQTLQTIPDDAFQDSHLQPLLQPSDEVKPEPLSARSHHEHQAEILVEAGDFVDQGADEGTLEIENDQILSELITATVGDATQILSKHFSSPGIVMAALRRLDELCCESEANRSEAMEADTIPHVLSCLSAYELSVDSYATALSLLSSLSFARKLQYRIFEKDGIGCILSIMKAQASSVKVQFRACRALCNIGYESGEIQLQMVGQGCIPLILSAMERFLSSPKVQAEGCGVLCNLAANNDSNYKLILEHGGLSAVVQAMSMHGSQLGVLYKGCCAVCSLTTLVDSHSHAHEEGAASAVIKSMLMHSDNRDLLYKGCSVLGNLLQSARCAAAVAKQGGVAAIVKCLTGPATDLKLQSKGLRALHFLSKNIDNHLQVIRQGAVEATIEIMMTNRMEQEVQERGCAFLACVARNRSITDNALWQHKGIEAVVCAMRAHITNQSVIIEGSNVLAELALLEGVKEKIMEASILPDVQKLLESMGMPAAVHMSVQKLSRALFPLDSLLRGEAPDTRDSIRRSKVKGFQRPISATLQAGSRPPRPSTAVSLKRSRRPASATFGSGNYSFIAKGSGINNLMLQHQIEILKNEAETLRHENLKMMESAADSGMIAALKDVHGLQVGTTIKRRPVSALRAKSCSPQTRASSSPYITSTGSTGAPKIRPPSGKSVRGSKEAKAQKHEGIAERNPSQNLDPAIVRDSLRPESAQLTRWGVSPSQELRGTRLEDRDELLKKVHQLIASGRTNEQVIRHFSLIDSCVDIIEVEACRAKIGQMED